MSSDVFIVLLNLCSKQLLDDYNIFGGADKNKSWLGSKIYAGKNVSLQLSDLMA